MASSSQSTRSGSPGANHHVIHVRTNKRTELIHVTDEVQRLVVTSECKSGVCHLYVPHTTAAVIVNEGYDPDVASDMEGALDRLVPRDPGFRHAEGNSDSHIKTALCGSSETIWIENGQLMLGRWQVIFFCEFDGPRRRELRVKIVPDPS